LVTPTAYLLASSPFGFGFLSFYLAAFVAIPHHWFSSGRVI
jgi:hypothetical protein